MILQRNTTETEEKMGELLFILLLLGFVLLIIGLRIILLGGHAYLGALICLFGLALTALVMIVTEQNSNSVSQPAVSTQAVTAPAQTRVYNRYESVFGVTLSQSGEMSVSFYLPDGSVQLKTLTVTFKDKHDQPLTKKKYTLTEVE